MKKIFAVVLVLSMVVLMFTGCAEGDYKKAAAALESGDYALAKTMYEKLGDYKDCADMVKECDFLTAKKQYDDGDLASAVKTLEQLGDYKESAELLTEAKDELITQTLVGTWVSQEIDGSDLFMTELEDAPDDAQEILKYFETPAFKMKLKIEFTKEGTIVETLDADHFQGTVDSVKASFRKAIVAYFEELLSNEFASQGISLEDAMESAGISDIEGLMAAFNIDVDSLVEESLGDMLNGMADSIRQNGTYKVEEGVVTLNVGTEAEKGTFDLEKDELTLTGEGVPEKQKFMYPVTCTRQ